MGRFKVVFALLITSCALTMIGCPSNNVIIMDNYPDITLKSIGQDIVNFFNGLGSGSPIEVGDIIVGSQGGGFLRKVLGIGESGGNILTQTGWASLVDAIENGSLDGRVSWTTDDFSKSGASLAWGGSLTLDLSGLTLFSQDGVTVSISKGTLTYAPDITLKADFANHKLTGFESDSTGALTVDMNFKLAATKDATLNYETPIIPAITKPFIFYIGPVPVVGTASLSFPFGISGTISAGASAESGFDGTTSINLGASFDGKDWTNLSSLGDFEPTAHPLVITLASSAGLDIYVKVNAGLNLYGASNLTGYVEPYVAADAQFIPSPFTFVLTAGINGGLNYQLGIFDINLINKSWFFPGPSWELYRYSIPYTVPTTFTFNLPL